jgi:hypothetical protein
MGRQARFASGSRLLGRGNESTDSLSERLAPPAPGSDTRPEVEEHVKSGGRSKLARSVGNLLTLCWGGRGDADSVHGEPRRRRQRRSGSLRRGGRSSVYNAGNTDRDKDGEGGEEEDYAPLLAQEKQQEEEYHHHHEHHVARPSAMSRLTMATRRKLQRSYHML